MTTTAEWRKWNAVQTKSITNADRIRSMTDEEMAEFMVKIEVAAYKRREPDVVCNEERFKAQWLDWLKKEVTIGN